VKVRRKRQRKGLLLTPGVDCPVCNLRLAPNTLRQHLIKIHRRRPGQFQNSGSAALANTGTNENSISHAGDRTPSITLGARARDGSAGLSSFARERGRFGSYPEFDGDT